MIAKDLICNSIIPLKTSDTGSYAISYMEECKVSHLPIVNNVEFLGLISDNDINNTGNLKEPIGNHKLSLVSAFVYEHQHIYEIIKIAVSLKLSLVPVLNDKNKYLGIITLNDLLQSISKILVIQNPGGIIVLELNNNDYYLTEIAQIVESNDAKILSLYITPHSDSTKLEVTIKINKIDIYPILQTFYRYNYIVKASYSESNYLDSLQDRFDSLINYLNI
jgi:CBS domain-containing protein